jgi:hypothetical protein
MAVPGAPRWSWETGDEGWDMGGDWARDNDAAHSGSYSMDFYEFYYDSTYGWGYQNYEDDWTQWTSAYDFSLCAACTVNVGFYVYGNTETTYDGLYVECSGNGGSSWTEIGPEVMGSQSWSYVTRALPSGCLTGSMKLALRFESDVSIIYTGYVVDDLRVYTTATAPHGYLDSATAAAAGGWACDGDAWSDEIGVKLYFYRIGTGTPTVRTVDAGGDRPDLVTAGECGSTANHGWGYAYDADLLSWLGSGTHTVRAYGVDGPAPCGAGETELSNSPLTFSL